MQVLRRESVKFLFFAQKRRAVARLMELSGNTGWLQSLGHLSVISRS